ncbi:hypothetical protein N658DRAFT_525954 [Parathielavia hyrcaniae]|uniref:Defective in cullin neddylation protein n=1 Tax=Parathielavia hyrcaniae TaxID=113614 RepID=A0AAN6SYX0_9PEZI|nr:hypothetical protein N658DRAFT_525954 [Parathielavia hyrcaniae]
MPATSSTRRHQQAAEQFVAVTKASRDSAQVYLRNNNYDVEAAVNQFYSEAAQSNGPSQQHVKSSAMKAQLNQLFDELLPKDDESTPSPPKDDDTIETMGYVTETLGLRFESYELFVVLDIVQASSIFSITRSGFVDGWARAIAESEETGSSKRRKSKEAAGSSSSSSPFAYSFDWQARFVRSRGKHMLTDAAYFKSLYDSAFSLGKEPGHKALGMMLAVAFWEALYEPATHPWRSANVDWLAAWTGFLKERFGVWQVVNDEEGDADVGGEAEVVDYKRTVSKDLWTQLRLFAAKTMEDETLGFWSEEQAWPGLVDEFVVWCKDKGVVKARDGGFMEVEE